MFKLFTKKEPYDELVRMAKKLVRELKKDEQLEVDITSDNLIYIGYPPVFVRIRKVVKDSALMPQS